MKQEIVCSICNSEEIDFIKRIQPYFDKEEWLYNIYECSNCNTRFAREVENDYSNFHDLLYKESSGYEFYYEYADKVKDLLSKKNIKECEVFLKNITYFKYKKIIDRFFIWMLE